MHMLGRGFDRTAPCTAIADDRDRRPQTGLHHELAEREIKRRNAWIEKFDLELSILDGPRLSDQLIHARRFGSCAPP